MGPFLTLLRDDTPTRDLIVNAFEEVIAGRLDKQIVRSPGITPRTVKFHRGRVIWKLQITRVADLVRLGGARSSLPDS